MYSTIADIRDLTTLHRAMEQCQPEIVFHMAAQALVQKGYQEPIATFDVNVMGTAYLLEAVRQTPSVKAVVVVTSDKCYESEQNSVAHREEDTLGGIDPYSSSKACAELVVSAYRSSYFGDGSSQARMVASARAGNVIGGGDWSEGRLLPDIVRAVVENRPVAIRNPTAIRPWQHVLEPLGGYLLLAEKLCEKGAEFAEAWNFGPMESDAKSVEMVVRRVLELWGSDTSWISDQRYNPRETKVLRLSCRKAHDRLGWKPRWTLDQALEKTVAWYQGYFKGCNVRNIVLDQIETYESLPAWVAR